ncbi:diguanylate cyclase [Sulfuricaulis limicola]|uniref:diguanylate cyclase n=1 Tax=Sulfuricaulis limicola TaxID=1620215 RepID=A0A1B4XHG0_9GAMM|nr:diguanylate cyclase [Sulfuricaulis limicola]BAV34232.1 diguanylate cyclase [Sulfuricaulis limicola]
MGSGALTAVRTIFRLAASMLVALFALLAPAVATALDDTVRIGVLAHSQESLNLWSPTADYLTQRIPGRRFLIVPLDNHTIGPAVAQGEVEFVLTNPGSYVELEARYGVTRMLTLRNLRQGQPYTVFGSVIFTRADHPSVKHLEDLRGRSFMAVDKNAFGGFLMAWREFKDHGIDPFRDFTEIKFIGLPQDPIVYAVRDGKVDAGMVRTDMLERMAADGKIRLDQFRILNPQHAEGFPFALSTRLYPEWPFSKARQTSDELAQQVAIALLSLPPGHPAAQASKSAGWTVPLDYTPVHELYRELHVGPYEDYGRMSTADILRQYWHWIAGMVVLVVALSAIAFYILRLNRILNLSQERLLGASHDLERANRRLERMSTQDDLTGIANHRYFQEHLDLEWRRERRARKPLALLMIDVDYFKALNDALGHLTGDECLRRIAHTLAGGLHRAGDVVARYGGEEFAAILPETDARNAAMLAERLRAAIENMGFAHPASKVGSNVTVSIGVASLVPMEQQKPEELIAMADRALYRAKKIGRNCVVADGTPD